MKYHEEEEEEEEKNEKNACCYFLFPSSVSYKHAYLHTYIAALGIHLLRTYIHYTYYLDYTRPVDLNIQ